MNSPAIDDSELRPGDVAGNYRVVRRIGRGSMGTVYEVVHQHIERRAAIKVLASDLSGNPRFTRRFRDEANAVNRVRHPGLVEVFEFGFLDDGLAFFVMELLDGETLGARLAHKGRLAPKEALPLAREVAAAIGAAHARSIVHRDLKPDNVMLARSGEGAGERVKVLDFGVAKLEREGDPAHATHTGAALGTPHYMAPEQCIDAGRVGPPADVYSLGVMLFEMLAGRRPFVAAAAFDVMAMHVRQAPPPLAEAAPGLPPELCALVHAMLAKEAADRPSMDEVVGRLDAIAARLDDAPVVAGPAPVAVEARSPRAAVASTIERPSLLSRPVLLLASLLLLLAIAALIARVAFQMRARQVVMAPSKELRTQEQKPQSPPSPVTVTPSPSPPPPPPAAATRAPEPAPSPAVHKPKVHAHPNAVPQPRRESPAQPAPSHYEPIELEP